MKKPLHEKPDSQNKPHTYLALGDSYTIGEQVKPKENFPNQVSSMLKHEGVAFGKPKIVAKTGWTTGELKEAIAKVKISNPFDFVTLLIGVNNQYRGLKVSEYTPEFESLVNQAIQFANKDTSRVIILSIPDWGVTPFASGRDRAEIAAQIDEYNNANSQIASRYKVHYIDITKSSREAANDRSLLAADGLHPSAKEYEKWARQIAEIIKQKM